MSSKVVALIAALGLVLGAGWYVYVLRTENSEVSTELSKKNERVAELEEVVGTLSVERKELEERQRKAELERNQTRSDLQETLRKLRTQRPPVECNEAIDWAVANAGDMAW